MSSNPFTSVKTTCHRSLVGLSLLAVAGLVGAQQTYPKGTVTLVVPFPPGGTVDMVARTIGKHLGDVFGQPFVVDNRAGASGNIGAAHVVNAKADGQTLFVSSSGVLAANQFLYKNPGFDSQKQLTPVIRLVNQPNILLVHPSVPANNVQELIKLAKSQPGKLNMGNAGIGTGQDFAAREFIAAAGVDMLNVSYKGGAAALNDLLAGQIQVAFDTSPTALPYAKERNGKLRALAITSAKRSPLVPDLPTVAESGIPGFDSFTWIGLTAPTGTPSAIIERLNAELNKALKGEMGKKFSEYSFEPLGGTPAEMGAMIRKDSENYGAVLKAAGVEPQ